MTKRPIAWTITAIIASALSADLARAEETKLVVDGVTLSTRILRIDSSIPARRISKNNAEIHYELDVPAGKSGTLVLHLAGIDRIIAEKNGGFVMFRSGLNKKLSARKFAFQSIGDQHGLTVSVLGDVAGEISIVQPPTKEITKEWARSLNVHIPWKAAGSKKSILRITIRGFRGDALIALGKLPGADKSGSRSEAGISVAKKPVVPKPPTDAAAKRYKDHWQFFSGNRRAFKPLLADCRETTARFGYMYGRHGNTYMDAGLGGDILLHDIGKPDTGRWTISGRGLFSMRLNARENSAPVQNTDYIGGMALGYQKGKNSYELFVYHQSSHLGDEITDWGTRRRIDYVRETVRLLWSRQCGPVRVYAGPSFNVTGEPTPIKGKITLQGGAEYVFKLCKAPMYLAGDIQSKHENNYDLNFTGQIGLFLKDPKKNRHRPRLFLEFFNGFSNMGQFYRDRETYIMLGLGYDF